MVKVLEGAKDSAVLNRAWNSVEPLIFPSEESLKNDPKGTQPQKSAGTFFGMYFLEVISC
jgi:hypothetical protein